MEEEKKSAHRRCTACIYKLLPPVTGARVPIWHKNKKKKNTYVSEKLRSCYGPKPMYSNFSSGRTTTPSGKDEFDKLFKCSTCSFLI